MRAFTFAIAFTALVLCQNSGYGFYNPEGGRWLNRDPIHDLAFQPPPPVQRDQASLAYAFTENDSVNKVDLFGLIAPTPGPRQFKWRCEHYQGSACTFWYECTFLVNPSPPKDQARLDECMAKQRGLWDLACSLKKAVSLGRICKGYEKCHNDFGSGIAPLPHPPGPYPPDPSNRMPPSKGF